MDGGRKRRQASGSLPTLCANTYPAQDMARHASRAGEWFQREVEPVLVQTAAVENRILRGLPPVVFARLQPHLQRIALRRGQVLQESHRSLEKVYFIERGMAVLLARTKRDGQVGVGIVGRGGLAGMPVVLGTMRSPLRCLVEVPGEALQIGAEDLRRAIDESPLLRRHLMNYVQALLVQNAQTALCNARHELEQRLTRWLLLTHDRLDGDTVPFTHDLLSMMLGVRRAGVTAALERLARSGAVRKTRGAVQILDRALVEQRTCECYRIIKKEHERLAEPGCFEHVL
jgi:CRP-like cAMP-binding protein